MWALGPSVTLSYPSQTKPSTSSKGAGWPGARWPGGSGFSHRPSSWRAGLRGACHVLGVAVPGAWEDSCFWLLLLSCSPPIPGPPGDEWEAGRVMKSGPGVAVEAAIWARSCVWLLHALVPAQWSHRPAQGLPAWQQRTHGAKRRAWGVRAESSGWGWAVGQWVPSARAGRGPGQGCPPPCACWCRVWPSPARSPVRWAVSQWSRPPSARPQPARH